MVDVSEINSRKKLEAWLEALPQDTAEQEAEARRIAVTLAFRAAARIFPFAAQRLPTENPEGEKRDLTVLAVYRPLTISSVAALVPTDDIASSSSSSSSSSAAASAAAAYASASAAAAASAAYAAAAAAASAAYAAAAAYAAYADAAASAAAAASASAAAYAAAAAAAWSAIASDLSQLTLGDTLEAVPLWPEESPFFEVWAEVRARLSDAPDDWSPVFAWYEHLLDPKGRALSREMLTKIALIPPKTWNAGPKVALPVIGEIWGPYHSKSVEAVDLLQATLFNFTFDKLAGVMRAVPMPEDWKHLNDAELLGAFLEDATDLREDIATLCEALEREGAAIQGGLSTVTHLGVIARELERAPDVGTLRVGRLMDYGRILDANLTEDTRREFGVNYELLKLCVERLREIVRDHFAKSLARVDMLRSIRLEDEADADAVLRELRGLVEATLDGDKGRLVPLAPEDAAVLRDILDGVDQTMRRLDGATSEDARSAEGRDRDFAMAKVGATVAVYRDKAVSVVGKVDEGVSWTLRNWKKGTGLKEVVDAVIDLFGSGGGA